MLPRAKASWEWVSPEYPRVWCAKISRLSACATLAWRWSTGRRWIRVPNTICAPRLSELAHMVDPVRAQKVKNWHRESSTGKNGLTTRMKCSLKHKQKSAFPNSDGRPMQRNHIRSGMKPPWKKEQESRHRWTTQSIISAHPMDCRNSLTPQRITQARTEEWGAGWNRNMEARDNLLEQMQSPRQQTLLAAPRERTAKSAHHTLPSLKGNRARGVDGGTPGEILRLQKEQ